MSAQPLKLQLAVRTFNGAKRARILVEQLELLNRMLKAAERRHSFRVVPKHRIGYLAHLYNLALLGSFKTQDELDAFMLKALRQRAGTEQ